MKKITILFTLILMGFGFSGCGESQANKPQTITANKNIPAVLNNPISSQISGKVTATVLKDIYANMGRAVLIPKGSYVIGYYRNNNKIGEYRLDLVWTRIITPQGVNLVLTKEARGSDVKGYSGLVGEVIEKNWERYGMPLLVSTVFDKHPNLSSLEKLQETMQNDVSAVIKEYLQDQATTAPITLVKEGEEIFIKPNLDILFPASKNKEIVLEFFSPNPNEKIKERLISDYVLNREGLCRNGDERDCLENRRDKFNLKLQSSADAYIYLRQKDLLNELNKKRLSKEAKIEIISTTLIPKRTEAFVKFKVVEPKKKTRTYRIYLKYALEEAGKEPQNPFGFKVNFYEKEEIGRSKQGSKK